MIGSERKYLIVLLMVIFMVAGGAWILYSLSQTPSIESSTSKLLNEQKKTGRIGSAYFNFEIADSPAERVRGLSGREKLADTEAMIFIFDKSAKECFHMKDMKFNIDILWFDESQKLVDIKRDAMPSTSANPEQFCPAKAARYVVEVTAGVADKNQLKLGDRLEL